MITWVIALFVGEGRRWPAGILPRVDDCSRYRLSVMEVDVSPSTVFDAFQGTTLQERYQALDGWYGSREEAEATIEELTQP